MDDPHLAVLRQWMTAPELDLVRKASGSADDILERNRKVDRIIERAEQQEAIWQFLKRVAQAFIIIVGAIATIKAIVPSMAWWP